MKKTIQLLSFWGLDVWIEYAWGKEEQARVYKKGENPLGAKQTTRWSDEHD